jgi:hypothetical protein
MKEIVDAIDVWTNTEYSSVTRRLFGYCELMRKTAAGGSEQPIPVTIPTRAQVSLDDRYDLMTWIRLPGTIRLGNDVSGNDWGFGLDEGKVQTSSLRFIVAHKVALGESFIIDFINALPSVLNVSGYEVVSLDKNSINVDADHESIYTTELGRTVYEKHRFTWNIYAISLDVEFIPCK